MISKRQYICHIWIQRHQTPTASLFHNLPFWRTIENSVPTWRWNICTVYNESQIQTVSDNEPARFRYLYTALPHIWKWYQKWIISVESDMLSWYESNRTTYHRWINVKTNNRSVICHNSEHSPFQWESPFACQYQKWLFIIPIGYHIEKG